MASSSVNSKKPFRGLDSRKSQSWWWESHIAPRNNKWLAESLEDMERNYKHMLKLIEGEGDSFAKKAEMYYQRRPELLSHVEEFYRMYKLIADRYEHLTGELRKNLLPDLHSQGSVGSETGPEATSISSSADSKMSHRRSGHRAPGFDFFLGSGRSGFDRYARGDETSSISDSETESDVSSLYSYPGMMGGEEGPQMKTMELEVEPCDESKHSQHQENNNGSLRRVNSENIDDVHSKILDCEEEFIMGKQNMEEIDSLKTEPQKFRTAEPINSLQGEYSIVGSNMEVEKVEEEIDGNKSVDFQEISSALELDDSDPEQKIRTLEQELTITKGRLHALDREVTQLRKESKESSENVWRMQGLLKTAQKDVSIWKGKLEAEKRQTSKLKERIARYKASLMDRENEVRELKEVISDTALKYQLHAEISRLSDEKAKLEEKLREWEVHCHTLETQHTILERQLNDEIEHLKMDITEKTNGLDVLKRDLDCLKLKYDGLMTEKDELGMQVSGRDDQIAKMDKHLQHLVAENEVAHSEAENLRSRMAELMEEVERQRVLISDSAEEKREAIRQLCFSLEHYRSGYQQIRHAFLGHKQIHLLAS